MLTAVLAVATILGGLAALAYFWERRTHWIGSWIERARRAPAVPMSPASLFAYAGAHHRSLSLTRMIAERRGFQVRHIDSESAWLNEQVNALGIVTVRELDGLVRRHGKVASRMTDYLAPESRAIDSGLLLGCVLEAEAIQRGGANGLRAFLGSLRYTSGGPAVAQAILKAYEQARNG